MPCWPWMLLTRTMHLFGRALGACNLDLISEACPVHMFICLRPGLHEARPSSFHRASSTRMAYALHHLHGMCCLHPQVL